MKEIFHHDENPKTHTLNWIIKSRWRIFAFLNSLCSHQKATFDWYHLFISVEISSTPSLHHTDRLYSLSGSCTISRVYVLDYMPFLPKISTHQTVSTIHTKIHHESCDFSDCTFFLSWLYYKFCTNNLATSARIPIKQKFKRNFIRCN